MLKASFFEVSGGQMPQLLLGLTPGNGGGYGPRRLDCSKQLLNCYPQGSMPHTEEALPICRATCFDTPARLIGNNAALAASICSSCCGPACRSKRDSSKPKSVVLTPCSDLCPTQHLLEAIPYGN